MANAEHTACGKLIPTQLWDFFDTFGFSTGFVCLC